MERLFSLFTTTGGEIRQRDFWLGALALFVAGVVAGMIPHAGSVVTLALLYPWTCLALKRLRDIGRPEHWAGALVLLGLFSTGVSLLARSGLVAPMVTGPLLALGVLAGLLAIAFLVWLGMAPSLQGQHCGDPSKLTSEI